jgi:hypothetical protein
MERREKEIVTFECPTDLVRAADRVAQANLISRSALLRRMLARHLKQGIAND